MAELPDQIHERIVALSKEGDDLLQNKQYVDAIAAYVEALRLLPKPVEDWEAATWLFAAIGDAYFQKGDFPRAHKALQSAIKSPGGLGNPFIHLRLGQAQYEMGNVDAAKDELMRAYMGDAERVFEQENPKYFELIKPLIHS